MEKHLTIMMIVFNELKWVKLSVESIRAMGDVDDIDLIIVDNCSTDGLRDWAVTQTDFTYVYMDEGMEAYGRIINRVRQELNISGALLVMEGHYAIVPGTLSHLMDALYRENGIGAVGVVSNGLSGNQKLPSSCTSYEAAVRYAGNSERRKERRVIGLAPDAVLLNTEVLDALGNFDENIFGYMHSMRDQCLRMIVGGYKIMLCEDAVLWDLMDQDIYLDNTNQFWRIDEDRKYLEYKWGMHYFQYLYNEDMISMIEESGDDEFNVLEVGCDCGATLFEIKNRYPNANIYGTDLNPGAVRIASVFAETCINNIEEKNLPWDEHFFDIIIFGDVLEHLRDPKGTLEYCKRYLRDGGRIIASIPNVMHVSVMEQLLKGYFTYTEEGLLDKTHIHLFTGKEIFKMFRSCGFEIERIESIFISVTEEQSKLIDHLLTLGRGTERFMYETFQYLVKAKAGAENV